MFDRWRSEKKFEKRRTEALSAIAGERINVELMAQRPRLPGDPLDSALLDTLLRKIAEIDAAAKQATKTDDLDDLVADAELHGQLSAYLCPVPEIQHEGELVIDLVEGWGIPKTAIKRLRDLFSKKLLSEPPVARAALRALFEERDSWDDYTEEYEETMRGYARWLFGAAIVLPPFAVLAFHFAVRFSPLLAFGLLLAGAAGSSVSVMAKMPALDVSLSGELDAYRRRIFGRIGVGIVAGLIGCGGLGWLPISLQNQTFADAVAACTTDGGVGCAGTKPLLLLAIPLLLGFSERALTSFEQRAFGNRSRKG